MKLLVVEDEIKMGDYLQQGLVESGFVVDLVRTGLDGHHMAMTGSYDLIILDVMLPDVDGWRIVQALRDAKSSTPVLFLTARGSIEDRVKGLELGADDYLVKPFAIEEVVARLLALIRRSQGRSNNQLKYGDVSYDPNSQQVVYAGKTLELTIKETVILEQMLTHPNQTHSRASLEDKVYGWQQDIDSNAIEVHIHHLRKKLGDNFILTKRGMGYYLNPERQHS